MELCPTIKNILLLDSEGKRIAVKYYSDDWPTNAAKEAFEKAVFTKTQKTNARTEAEITMFDNYIVVYKFVQDLHFFVTGGENENEIILATVLQGFFDAVGLLLRGTEDKKEALENLDLILLCLDEIVDGGIILETDANVIAGKVDSHSMDAGAPLSEQTITQALATAREHLTRSLLKTEYILAADVVYIDVIAMLCFLDTICRAISLHPIKTVDFESGIEMIVIVFISVMIVMITSTKFIVFQPNFF
ncbi:hypothetical protein CXB51_015547 [Gossypium anomalum]|uniref:Coatomer subunit zeta n=7 Tax=Gossypium TaxID=3633 RepID=A0A8J5YI61_9ROSI|nr:hypothetical protein CXB51_015547 [Gossypium anomalum]